MTEASDIDALSPELKEAFSNWDTINPAEPIYLHRQDLMRLYSSLVLSAGAHYRTIAALRKIAGSEAAVSDLSLALERAKTSESRADDFFIELAKRLSSNGR